MVVWSLLAGIYLPLVCLRHDCGLLCRPNFPELQYNPRCKASPCLFNVVLDESESKDLSGDPAYADTLKSLQMRLAEVGTPPHLEAITGQLTFF